jgi:hypothetical protein
MMILDPTEARRKHDQRWSLSKIVSKYHPSFRLQYLHHRSPLPGLYKSDRLRLYHRRPERLNFVGDVVERKKISLIPGFVHSTSEVEDGTC